MLGRINAIAGERVIKRIGPTFQLLEPVLDPLSTAVWEKDTTSTEPRPADESDYCLSDLDPFERNIS